MKRLILVLGVVVASLSAVVYASGFEYRGFASNGVYSAEGYSNLSQSHADSVAFNECERVRIMGGSLTPCRSY